jgi:hypothetical protein
MISPFFLGTVTFIIGFTGCVGALRENTCLLAAVSTSFFSCFESNVVNKDPSLEALNLEVVRV